jgi:hypothetical protein
VKTLSAPVLTALASDAVAIVQLVELVFSSGTIRLNSSNWNLAYGGNTYTGAYGLGSVSPVTDQPGEVQGITLVLSGGDPLRIALALDSADEVQGATVRIRTAVISTTDYTVLDAPLDWVGKCDTMSIGEDGLQAEIRVSAESNAVDLLRGTPVTLSDADQQALFPGDRAFEYVVSQIDQPVIWPSREFFFK